MEPTITNHQKNVASLVHISTFAKYFFPFGNFFAPLLIWTFNKENHFVDEHGKQAINFQLSILVYMLITCLLCIPFFIVFATDFISLINIIDNGHQTIRLHEIKNLTGYIILFSIVGIILLGLFIFEIYAVVTAAMYAARGDYYKYPLNISFIKINHLNQSKNEHVI